ncbi:unnamed protein product [Amoebophrya sp. A25]|nr:unnamed protein product [Amoebophrya sp. A25]|eukprot:GSA25T00018096001.1
MRVRRNNADQQEIEIGSQGDLAFPSQWTDEQSGVENAEGEHDQREDGGGGGCRCCGGDGCRSEKKTTSLDEVEGLSKSRTTVSSTADNENIDASAAAAPSVASQNDEDTLARSSTSKKAAASGSGSDLSSSTTASFSSGSGQASTSTTDEGVYCALYTNGQLTDLGGRLYYRNGVENSTSATALTCLIVILSFYAGFYMQRAALRASASARGGAAEQFRGGGSTAGMFARGARESLVNGLFLLAFAHTGLGIQELRNTQMPWVSALAQLFYVGVGSAWTCACLAIYWDMPPAVDNDYEYLAHLAGESEDEEEDVTPEADVALDEYGRSARSSITPTFNPSSTGSREKQVMFYKEPLQHRDTNQLQDDEQDYHDEYLPFLDGAVTRVARENQRIADQQKGVAKETISREARERERRDRIIVIIYISFVVLGFFITVGRQYPAWSFVASGLTVLMTGGPVVGSVALFSAYVSRQNARGNRDDGEDEDQNLYGMDDVDEKGDHSSTGEQEDSVDSRDSSRWTRTTKMTPSSVMFHHHHPEGEASMAAPASSSPSKKSIIIFRDKNNPTSRSVEVDSARAPRGPTSASPRRPTSGISAKKKKPQTVAKILAMRRAIAALDERSRFRKQPTANDLLSTTSSSSASASSSSSSAVASDMDPQDDNFQYNDHIARNMKKSRIFTGSGRAGSSRYTASSRYTGSSRYTRNTSRKPTGIKGDNNSSEDEHEDDVLWLTERESFFRPTEPTVGPAAVLKSTRRSRSSSTRRTMGVFGSTGTSSRKEKSPKLRSIMKKTSSTTGTTFKDENKLGDSLQEPHSHAHFQEPTQISETSCTRSPSSPGPRGLNIKRRKTNLLDHDIAWWSASSSSEEIQHDYAQDPPQGPSRSKSHYEHQVDAFQIQKAEDYRTKKQKKKQEKEKVYERIRSRVIADYGDDENDRVRRRLRRGRRDRDLRLTITKKTSENGKHRTKGRSWTQRLTDQVRKMKISRGTAVSKKSRGADGEGSSEDDEDRHEYEALRRDLIERVFLFRNSNDAEFRTPTLNLVLFSQGCMLVIGGYVMEIGLRDRCGINFCMAPQSCPLWFLIPHLNHVAIRSLMYLFALPWIAIGASGLCKHLESENFLREVHKAEMDTRDEQLQADREARKLEGEVLDDDGQDQDEVLDHESGGFFISFATAAGSSDPFFRASDLAFDDTFFAAGAENRAGGGGGHSSRSTSASTRGRGRKIRPGVLRREGESKSIEQGEPYLIELEGGEDDEDEDQAGGQRRLSSLLSRSPSNRTRRSQSTPTPASSTMQIRREGPPSPTLVPLLPTGKRKLLVVSRPTPEDEVLLDEEDDGGDEGEEKTPTKTNEDC